jgi:hypothetical protein
MWKLDIGTASGWLQRLVRHKGNTVPKTTYTSHSRLKASSLVALCQVHPRLELPDLDAGRDVPVVAAHLAHDNGQQAAQQVTPQRLGSAGGEHNRGVHESAPVAGADLKGIAPDGPALDPVGLETLDSAQGIVQLPQKLRHGGVGEIARVLQDDMRHAPVLNVARIGKQSNLLGSSGNAA